MLLFALMLLRVPIGIAMGLIGVAGFGLMGDFGPALKLLSQSPIRTATEAGFGVIPMFLLMGAIASASGMSRELFQAANSFLGHRRGGLGMATIAACAGFAAISGSSVATAATFSAVAYPEMRRHDYPQSFATGVIAAGGTLGAMIPPSLVLAVYGIITQQDIGRLYIAGIIPGILAASMYIMTITAIAIARPELPTARQAQLVERALACAAQRLGHHAAVLVRHRRSLRRDVHGDARQRAWARAAPSSSPSRDERSPAPSFVECLVKSLRTTAAIFTILIGALLFGYFLTVTQTPQKVTQLLTGLGFGPIRHPRHHHADVPGAGLRHGRHGDDHPDDPRRSSR